MESEEEQFLHDISTPLSVILFQLESALNITVQEESRARLSKTLEQVEQIVALLEERKAKLLK